MKTLLAATAAVVFAVFMSLTPVWAAEYGPPTAGQWHYAWEYHYVGHHPHYEGGWILTK
jgi:Spy/CpxP family protein refolding chaperone